MTERVILCEGYHDRAFWAGALMHLGCVEPKVEPDGSRKPLEDPSGKRVVGADFGFYTPTKNFVRVRPCSGKTRIPDALRLLIAGLPTRPIERIVVNIDDDGDIRLTTVQGGTAAWVKNLIVSVDGNATPDGADLVVQGTTRVSITSWWTGDAHTSGLPWQQTLERVVCAAIDATYPGRASEVGKWLSGMPSTDVPKAHAWSHMAGWYSDAGGEAFYRLLWSDAAIVAQLQRRLSTCGVWQVLQAVAS